MASNLFWLALVSLPSLPVGFASNNCPTSNGTWPAKPWPEQHSRLEMQYTPFTGPDWSSKPIWYDWTNRNYRADLFYVSGPTDASTLYNFSSIWKGNVLTMITFADPRSSQPQTCIQLDMGFGMM
jgi:hypothetical protein